VTGSTLAKRFRVGVVFGLWSIASACGAADTVTLTLNGHDLAVEVADQPDERVRGLMYRDSLGADSGMLFVYTDDAERRFWMKDTRIPLSIAYLDAGGRIVKIADLQPLNETGVPSGRPARYALEVNQGWFAKNGVVEGSVVEGVKDAAKKP
jgi:uncharacterized membrane protein (UPF0127 family)